MSTISITLKSLNQWVADGTQTIWNFSFAGGYINQNTVKANITAPDGTVTDVAVTAAMFAGAYQLILSPAVPNGNKLTIYRDSSNLGIPMVTFQDGVLSTGTSLNTANQQAIFLAVEAVDYMVANAISESAIGVALSGGAGGSLVGFYSPNGLVRMLQSRLTDFPTVKDFGAIGDGASHLLSTLYSTLAAAQLVYPHATSLSDEIDWCALQAAANLHKMVDIPPGTYSVNREVVLTTGSRLRGAGSWSGATSLELATSTSVIKWTGPSAANTCIVRCSAQPVSVEPVSTAASQLQNITLCDVVLQGSDVCRFGFYVVRGFWNNVLDRITVTGTVEHGFWAGTCFGGTRHDWIAIKNQGKGITLGIPIASWGWSSATVDQCTFISCYGRVSGTNQSTVYLNQFNSTSAKDLEYGIGVGGGRGLVFVNAQADNCGGAGIYVAQNYAPIMFIGGYCEANGHSTQEATNQGLYGSCDLMVDGQAGGISNHVSFDGMHLGLFPYARLTGTAPSRKAGRVKFVNMDSLPRVVADWPNFSLRDCDPTDPVLGAGRPTDPSKFPLSRPYSVKGVYGKDVNTDIVGTASFTVSGTTLTVLMMSDVIQSIVYTSTGTYTITLKETFSSGRMAVALASAGNTKANVDVTTNTLTITHYNSAGALSDTAVRLSVMFTAYYASA